MDTRPSISDCVTCLKLISKSVIFIKDAKRKRNQTSEMICNSMGCIRGIHVARCDTSQFIKSWHFVSTGRDLVQPWRFKGWRSTLQTRDRTSAIVLEVFAISLDAFGGVDPDKGVDDRGSYSRASSIEQNSNRFFVRKPWPIRPIRRQGIETIDDR